MVCLSIMTITITLYATSLPFYYQILNTICPQVQCAERLNFAQLVQLNDWGFSLNLFAIVWFNAHVLFVAFFLGVALLLLLRKSYGQTHRRAFASGAGILAW